nr:ulp1 protease family, C-terminal catalytic domain-containing protein [Tanacetum cinerariifolium]
MKGFRRSGRLKGKGPVVEENTIEDAIDVDEYVRKDENVSQDEGSEHIIGTQVDNKDVGPSTSGKIAKKGKIDDIVGVDILDVDIVKDEEIIKIWEDQYGTNKVKPNDVKYMIRKSKVADMNFKLNFIVLFTSIIGGVKTKGYYDLSVLDHINIKIKSEGLGKGELAGLYVEEEDDPMPDNLEGFMWKMNNYVDCIKIERAGFEKTMDVAKRLYPGNTILANLKEQYIKSLKYHNEDNERTARVHTDDSTMTNQRKESSLETDEDFDTPMMGSDTQLVVFESADKLYEEFERNKRIIDLEIPSFSLGLTQEDEMETGLYAAEYEMGPKTHEEVIKTVEKCEQEFYVGKVPLNYMSPTKEMMRRRKRVITESERMKSPFYFRVVNADKDENIKDKKLAVYLFSKMAGDVSDVLFETKYSQQSSRGQIESLGPQELVDNNLLSSWSAYLNFFEGKKTNIHLQAEIIEAQLVRGTFDWQTDKRSKDCGIFLMRHRESYMGNEIGKWKCGLDDEGKKQNTQLGHLRNKYAAKILLSDCNMYKSYQKT